MLSTDGRPALRGFTNRSVRPSECDSLTMSFDNVSLSVQLGAAADQTVQSGAGGWKGVTTRISLVAGKIVSHFDACNFMLFNFAARAPCV